VTSGRIVSSEIIAEPTGYASDAVKNMILNINAPEKPSFIYYLLTIIKLNFQKKCWNCSSCNI
jgi:hypothetical protein